MSNWVKTRQRSDSAQGRRETDSEQNSNAKENYPVVKYLSLSLTLHKQPKFTKTISRFRQRGSIEHIWMTQLFWLELPIHASLSRHYFLLCFLSQPSGFLPDSPLFTWNLSTMEKFHQSEIPPLGKQTNANIVWKMKNLGTSILILLPPLNLDNLFIYKLKWSDGIQHRNAIILTILCNSNY